MARIVVEARVVETRKGPSSANPVVVEARRESPPGLVMFPWPDTTTVPDIGARVRVTIDLDPGD